MLAFSAFVTVTLYQVAVRQYSNKSEFKNTFCYLLLSNTFSKVGLIAKSEMF